MIDDPIPPKSRIPETGRSKSRFSDSDPLLSDPIAGDPIRDPYHNSSRISSPGQILVGLVLVIAVVVGLGLLFGTDSSDERAPQITEVQPQAQPEAQPPVTPQPQVTPEQSSQAPSAPAAGTATSTN